MKFSRSLVAMAVVALIVMDVVSSQLNAEQGNPKDAKDTAANSLDTNPAGKTEPAGTNTTVDNTSSATNKDNTSGTEGTAAVESGTSETGATNGANITNGASDDTSGAGATNGTGNKNGAANGNGKNGQLKRRRKNMRRGRKRNGTRRKPPQQNDSSSTPTKNPTTPPVSQEQPKVQDQPNAQDQVGTQDTVKVKGQPQTQKLSQKQSNVQEQTKPKDQTQTTRQAQTQAQTTHTKPDTTPSSKSDLFKEEPKTKSASKPRKSDAQQSKDQPSIFNDFFDYDQTTTTEASNIGPPPNITFDKSSQKIMPTVDTEGSKAHDGSLCNETYKPHANNSHKYMMMFSEGVWGTLDCPPNRDKGLVWRQDLCSCGEELIAQDPNDWCAEMGFSSHPTNRHKYTRIFVWWCWHNMVQIPLQEMPPLCKTFYLKPKRKTNHHLHHTLPVTMPVRLTRMLHKQVLRHHGAQAQMYCAANLVWSQEKCLCMFDPTVKERPIETPVTFVCKKILHLEFEGNLDNSAEAYHVQPVKLRRRGKLPRIRYVKVPGALGKAAMIVSQPLEFLAFRGNDFQKHVTYSLNFKISPRHLDRANYMVLITDECLENRGGPKLKKPSIILRFQPNTKTFHLEFRTEEVQLDEIIKGAVPDMNGWYKTVVYFEDNSLNLENNGKKLYTVTGIQGKIPQNKCPLYIAGRGSGFDRSQDFYGYMDNVLLIKDCTFHEADIKIL